MPKKLALIHTYAPLTSTFSALCREVMPDVEIFHMVDESLLHTTLRLGKLVPWTYRRLADWVTAAADAGADVIMVTCSSIGPTVDVVSQLVSVPVLRVDQAMADRAVALGSRVGVIATLPTTLGPTSDLVVARGKAAGKTVEVRSVLCEGAFKAVSSGDTATHDRIVGGALRDLGQQVDAVVLAQASMARVAEALPAGEVRVPIFSSPRLGVERARLVIDQLG